MSLDSSNCIVYIPKTLKIEDHIEMLVTELRYHVENDSNFDNRVNKTIESFKSFQFKNPILDFESFDGNEYIYYTIEHLVHELCTTKWFGMTRAYRREMYNISANKDFMKLAGEDINAKT